MAASIIIQKMTKDMIRGERASAFKFSIFNFQFSINVQFFNVQNKRLNIIKNSTVSLKIISLPTGNSVRP